jgi:putative membrane protein
MIHRKTSLSTLSAIAVAIGVAACGGSRQTQANAPAPAPMAPANEQYGAAMGQPGTAPPGTEMAPAPGAQMGPQAPGAPPSGGMMGGTTPGPYGGQGTMGGTTGQMPPSAGTETGTTTMTPPGGGMGGTTGSMGAPSTMGGAPSTMGGGTEGPSGAGSAMGGSADVSSFDDAQLAAVVQALNMGEMQTAQLAESKASSPEVKKFARDMMTQHREMQNRANAVFSRTQITPNDNAVSNQLKSDAQSDVSTLQGMRGKDFDREYMDQQVRAHNHALELIDRMLPNAKSHELKAELQGARMKVEAHLRQAERIQQTLQKGATSKQHNAPSTTPTP